MIQIPRSLLRGDSLNLNTKKANFPGIDLATDDFATYGSSTKKIAFQITSTNDIAKIKKTLKGYVKGKFYEEYDEMYVYNLIEKQKSYQKASVEEVEKIVDGKFTFDLDQHVIDRTDLEQKIGGLKPISKIEKIHKLLEDQFVYNKKSLLSMEIWESDGKIGYGFSNLINGIDLTTYNTLIKANIPTEAKEVLQILLSKYNSDFAINYGTNEKDKFKNLAFNSYLKAGFTQALSSFQVIKDNITFIIEKDIFEKKLSDSFAQLNDRIDESNFPLINQPTNHPAILLIKTTIARIFNASSVEDELRDLYLKDFNLNIQTCIIETFGREDYDKHLDQTKDKWIRENESDLLIYMKDLAKLEFVDGEELQYQETCGTWQDVRSFGKIDESIESQKSYKGSEKTLSKIERNEARLKSVEILIDEYFDSYKENEEGYLNNILFLIADFGKGKSSFLHHYASVLAKQYLKSHEGLFPIYINLNEYDKYSNSPSLGVMANYLAKRFKIDIKDDYFKKKEFVFLVDSLDECGELTETNIEKVIKDIVEIQNLDNINQRDNRLIVASRPIANGLKEQITKYKPYSITIPADERRQKETIDNYISVYGFKKVQFDNYVEFALKNDLDSGKIKIEEFTGFSKKILTRISKSQKIKLYADLYGKVLKESELKRPIFAYMIYKLISSNSNFIDSGKVGVYISFLNQLSRDAKHKDDCNYRVSLKDEFIYRNVLHASSLLWQFKRQSGEQTSLTKADICRTIMGDEINKDDRKVMEQFPDIDSIHFLSHSYLGEKESTLHFQHQSFAEILLAEYYLKVFIKYAIEEDTNFEDARILLSVGLPTDQTIDFLKGLLLLLKESVLGNPKDKKVLAKRSLLIPLLASMSIKEHNKRLYSTRLNAMWFEKYEDDIFSKNNLNEEMIKDFPIRKKMLDKIELLCENIIGSSKIYLMEEPTSHTVLFKKELMSINDFNGNYLEIDKWLALMVGNIIGTEVDDKRFFNSNINAEDIFSLIRNWNYHTGKIPSWARDCFMGVNMEHNVERLVYKLDIAGINFSYSYFKKLELKSSNVRNCSFKNSKFEFFVVESSEIAYSNFDNVEIVYDHALGEYNNTDAFNLLFCDFIQGVLFPKKLNDVLKGNNIGRVNYGVEYTVISNIHVENFIQEYFLPLKGIFEHIIRKGHDTEFITSAFRFETESGKIDHVLSNELEEFIRKIEAEVQGSNEEGDLK